MSDTFTLTRYGEAVVIRFDGLDADEHEIDMSLLAESLKGLSRIIGVAGNFAATNKLLLQKSAFSLKVVVKPPESHCFELIAWLKWINESPLLTTVAGGLVVSLVAYIFQKAAGEREEMKQLRGALDTAIRELGNRDQGVIDRLLGTIDRMAEVLRPAVKQAVAPIGETARTLTVSNEKRTMVTSIGTAEREAILSDEPITVGDEGLYKIKITELDIETGTCKLSLDHDTDARIAGTITDPAFSIPNNPYVLAMARQTQIEVTAKPILKNGEISRLFISNSPSL